MNDLLKVKGLKVYFQSRRKRTLHYNNIYDLLSGVIKSAIKSSIIPNHHAERALDQLDCCVKNKETIGVIGISGAGKSVFAKAVVNMLNTSPGIVSGSVVFDGKSIFKKSPDKYWKFEGDEEIAERGKGAVNRWQLDNLMNHFDFHFSWPFISYSSNPVSMIFQDPSTYLNPWLTLYEQLLMPLLKSRRTFTEAELEKKMTEVLKWTRFDQEKFSLDNLKKSNTRMSGGELQQFMTAIAMAFKPKLVIADEPTTDLDVFNAYCIRQCLKDFKEKRKASMILISHDLKLVDELADHVLVFYDGHIVESFSKSFSSQNDFPKGWPAKHPYTKSLIGSFLRLYESSDVSFIRRKTNLKQGINVCRFRECQHWYKFYPACQEISEGNHCEESWSRCAMGIDSQLWEDFITSQNKRKDVTTHVKQTAALLKYNPFSWCLKELTSDLEKEREKNLILHVKDLSLGYNINENVVHSVNLDLFSVDSNNNGQADGFHLGIIGETGSGKSTLAKGILKLIRPSGGRAYYDAIKIKNKHGAIQPLWGKDAIKEKDFRRQVQLVPQDCGQALHSKKTLREILERACELSGKDAENIYDLWKEMGLKDSDLYKRPEEMSGVMQRRAFIVRSLLSLSSGSIPKVLVLDEVVKGIDLSAQEEILAFFREYAYENGITYINISHNLSVIRTLSDIVAVMLGGRIIEICDSQDFFEINNSTTAFFHPYSRLIKTCGEMTTKPLDREIVDKIRFDYRKAISGTGCPFYHFCEGIESPSNHCMTDFPKFKSLSRQRFHFVACYVANDYVSWREDENNE